MKRFLASLLLLATFSVCAQTNQVNKLRFWSDTDHTRLVLEMSGVAKYKVFRLDSPDRLVIDFKNTQLKARLPKKQSSKSYVKKLRSGVRNRKDLRIVLDLKYAIKSKVFKVEKDANNSDRLVVDLFASQAAMRQAEKSLAAKSKTAKAKAKLTVVARKKLPTKMMPKKTSVKKKTKRSKYQDNLRHATGRDLIIAIDAGHGGKDSGALGKRGGKEKHIALAIAKKMATLVNKEPGMRAVLVRKGDYFIPLKRRVEIADKHGADLFVSIHADAFATTAATGASVYTLSNRGATSAAARLLAQRENRSDQIGGVELSEQSSDLAKVLIDLAQTGSMDASYEVAGSVLSELRHVGKVHNRKVQKAGFAVLKSASIPSILVETAYISNPAEERKLKDSKHQRRLASSILKGVKRYFRSNPVPGSLIAGQTNKEYVVAGGDTLTEVANRFNLDVSELKSYNALSSNNVRIGQILQIPK